MDTFNWSVDLPSTNSIEKQIRVVKFGDGYEQRQSIGIAPALKTWSAAKTARKAEADSIEAFLLNHVVEPFYWNPCNDGQKKYVLDGAVSRSSLGAGWVRLTWTAREVRA